MQKGNIVYVCVCELAMEFVHNQHITQTQMIIFI